MVYALLFCLVQLCTGAGHFKLREHDKIFFFFLLSWIVCECWVQLCHNSKADKIKYSRKEVNFKFRAKSSEEVGQNNLTTVTWHDWILPCIYVFLVVVDFDQPQNNAECFFTELICISRHSMQPFKYIWKDIWLDIFNHGQTTFLLCRSPHSAFFGHRAHMHDDSLTINPGLTGLCPTI